jgi:hypothetical protein
MMTSIPDRIALLSMPLSVPHSPTTKKSSSLLNSPLTLLFRFYFLSYPDLCSSIFHLDPLSDLYTSMTLRHHHTFPRESPG